MNKGVKGTSVQAIFERIAEWYDLMNKIMTFGLHKSWKRNVALIAASGKGTILDIGAGTGDIATLAKGYSPRSLVVAVDFSAAMISRGITRKGGCEVIWCGADALHLPFQDHSFDAVTSGYLIRNVSDPLAVFKEQKRVLKPGGRVVCLDTSPPGTSTVSCFIRWYLRRFIPLIGSLIDRKAYQYLADSTQTFMEPERLSAVMAEAGFERIWYKSLLMGTQAIHVGSKPTGPG